MEPKLDTLVNLIGNDGVKFVVGIEKDGYRYFIKSEFSAPLIGHFYRKALKEEKPVKLTNKFLPFPDFGEILDNR
jgi:hypothetical protein